MTSLKLLDVTLRDGGYINNFDFSEEELNVILPALDASGVDFVEVGYRNGTVSFIQNLGVSGLCSKEYLLFCKKHLQTSQMAVMAHCKNIDKGDIKELKACGVSLLRLSAPRGEHANTYSLIGYAKDEGLLVSVNIIHVSQYTREKIIEAVECILPYEPSCIYFADSNGSMHPDQVASLYEHCSKYYKIPFGFHAHDNLGLAQTNTLAAMAAGAQFIDASLAGAGKGIGNLKMEFFAAYLHSIQNKKYKLQPLISAINTCHSYFSRSRFISESEFERGIFDLLTKEMGDYFKAKSKQQDVP